MSVVFKALRAIESRDGRGRRDTPEVRVAEGASTTGAVPLLLGIATLALLVAAVILGFNGIEEQPRARPIVEAKPDSARTNPGYDSVIVANSTTAGGRGELDDSRSREAGVSHNGTGRRTDSSGNAITETGVLALEEPAATTRMVFQPAADKGPATTLAATGSWQDLRRVSASIAGPAQSDAAAESEEALIERARGIHERVITMDTHDDINPANFTAERNYTLGGEPRPSVTQAWTETEAMAVRDPEPLAGPGREETSVVVPDIAAKPSMSVDAVGGPLEDEETVATDELSLAAVAAPELQPAPTAEPTRQGPIESPRVDTPPRPDTGNGDAGFYQEERIGQVSVTRVGDAERMRLLNQRLAAAITHRNEQQINSILVAMVHVVGIDSVFMLKTRAFTQLALDGDAGLAMNLLQQVLARDPTDVDAAINMAVAEIKLGYREQARRRLHNLASAAPHDVRVEGLLRSIR